MGIRAVDKGPTAVRVAKNISALREARKLTLKELSERMAAAGRRILPTGLLKIEQGDRRVDADDIVALAIALGVTPNRLLLPADAGSDEIALTETQAVPALTAWRWASGTEPLPEPATHDRMEAARQFRRENRPHERDLYDMTGAWLLQHQDVLSMAEPAFEAAETQGIGPSMLAAYYEFDQQVTRQAARAPALRKPKLEGQTDGGR